MVAGRVLLAPALCLVLILQVASVLTVPAQAQSEWTGTIDKVVDWTNENGDTEDYIIGGEITFTVEGGRIFGNGIAWIEYTVVVKNGEYGDCLFEGRHDNLEFEFSGDYDENTGKADLTLDPPSFYDNEPTHIPGSREANFCRPGGLYEDYLIAPFANSYAYPSYDLGSFDLVDGATIDGQLGYGDAGYNRLVIYGPTGQKNECPELAITPTMPPAYDPRNLAGPTDTASYRFNIAWEGTTPVKVNFDVQGGNDSVNPIFAFNPANMQTSPINVIMDVSTSEAEEGEYPITIDAWVIDPETGEECHAARTTVTLVVGESRAVDLPLIKRVGQVEITPEDTEAGGQNVILETGNDGAATFIVADTEKADDSVSITTVDVGSNTAIKEYDHVDYIERILEDKAKTAETLAWTDNDLLKYKGLSDWESLKSAIFAADANLYSCLFALDANTIEICGEQSIVYVSNGEVHLDHKSAKGEAADRLLTEIEKQAELSERTKPLWDKLLKALATPNTCIIPNGTEITVNVQQSAGSSVTSVTVLDGSALVVDLVSEEITLVNAGERYTLETSFAGQSASSTDTLESISSGSILHWWILQVGDHTTFDDRDDESWPDPARTDRKKIFSDQDEVWLWTKFLNALPGEHEINFKSYSPDGQLADESPPFRTLIEGSSYYVWPDVFFALYDLGYPAGRWTVNVYADGYLVDEMFFYEVEYATMDKQSATYALEVKVEADDPELRTAFANGMAAGFSSEFASMENVNTESAADIEWIKATIRGDSSTDARIYPELKVKNYPTILGSEISLLENNNMLFAIPTVGLDNDFAIPTTGEGEGFPSELIFVKEVDVDVGGSIIKAYEFTGSKKLAQGASSSELTITADYEKHTGMLVNYIASGKLADAQLGNVDFTLDLKATEMSIPTALTISPLSGQISQNQDLKISGSIIPAVDDGQVVLTYQRNGNEDEPIKRTATVTNGTFSDTYKMDKDGMYTVSAEYLGSGAYLSSISDATTLTVAPSGCLIATAAFGSELTPQVQFLRNFRDNHILSTAAGSSFMTVFNSWYYSFSPAVADYEREQPWLQAAVKAAIYPLLGILQVSENAYSLIPGEYGALSAGMVASGMIGALYLSPVALSIKQVRKSKFNYRLAIFIIAAAFIAVVGAILASNETALMITTSLFVLSIISVTAILSGKALMKISQKLKDALRKP